MFFNPELFPTLLPLKDHWMGIRNEYDLLKQTAIKWHESIHNGKWDVVGLQFQGHELPGIDHAPVTSKLCKSISGIHTFGFSILRSGCEITPHRGYTGEVLRAHLGLYTNPRATLSVNGESRTWQDGELLVFDDTELHSACNHGTHDRVVLLIDFYKPVQFD